MTSPITPDPSIHNQPPQAQGAQPSHTGLMGAFANLPLQIISMILNAILGTIESLPFIGPLLTPILQPIQNIFTNLFSALGVTNPSALSSSPSSFNVNSILGPLEKIPILGPIISIVDGFLGGIFNVSSVAPSAIGSQSSTANLILNGAFASANSLATNPDWTWDTSHDHTGTAGSGSAKTVLDGTTKMLLSNAIAVSTNQVLNISGWTMWSGLVYPPGNVPIFIGLQTYDSTGKTISNVDLQNVNFGATNSSWVQLQGTYTVPAGMASVSVSLNVGSSATAGTVWFDDLSAVITGSPLVSAITGGGSNSSILSNPLGFLGNFFNDLLSLFGLGGLFGSPGSSQQSGGTGTGSNAGGTSGNNLFNPTTGLQGLLNKMLPAGALSANTPVPARLLSALHPSTANNVVPDPYFMHEATVDGQGLWIWDWPGSVNQNAITNLHVVDYTTMGVWNNSGGSIRTRRPGTIPVYYVPGTWEIGPGMTGLIVVESGGPTSPQADPKDYLNWQASDFLVDPVTGLANSVPNTNLLDWEHFDLIKVNYPASMFDMGGSVQEGVRRLVGLINAIPGPFIMIGHSQGGFVISNVLDELRYGTLQHRYNDLLLGVGIGNMRRQQGTGFKAPDGTEVIYDTQGYGISVPTLQNTPTDKWWEWAVPAGTYPAHGQMSGITYHSGDDISTLVGNTTVAAQERAAVANVVSQTSDPGLLAEITQGLSLINSPAGTALIAALSGTAPHNTSHYAIQPFLAQGDTRTFYEYLFDHINSLAGDAPAIGSRHQLLGVPVAVQPEQVITAGASVEWLNVVASGLAIYVGVNAYDSNGNLLATVTAAGASISNPEPTGGWVDLKADFVMPPGAALACLVLDVEPEVMTTGTVWFCNAFFEPTSLIDAALLANIQNIPQIPGQNIQGPQGVADMLTAVQGVLDGLGSANAADNLSNVQLAALFQTQAQAAINAAQALDLAVSSTKAVFNNSTQPTYNGLQPTGEVTFPLTQTLGATLPSTSIAAGTSLIGFINCGQAATKGFLEFMANGTGGSGVYVNIYKVDPTTGALTNLWASSDISGSIANGSWGWVSVTLPGNAEVPVTQGELIALEIVAQNSGINVVAAAITTPNHPSMIPTNLGATRTTASSGGVSPTTVLSSNLTFGGAGSYVPFITFGVANVPASFEPPNQTIYTSEGQYTYEIPSWVQSGDSIDAVALGGGGSGVPGGKFLGQFSVAGLGGAPGQWAADTYVYGTDIPLGTRTLTVTVGAGGVASTVPQGQTQPANANGQPSIVQGAARTLTAAGGAAGGSQAVVLVSVTGAPPIPQTNKEYGQSAGNFNYRGRMYFGGLNILAQLPGNPPGGGGGCGEVRPAGPGADGQVWITARQAGT